VDVVAPALTSGFDASGSNTERSSPLSIEDRQPATLQFQQRRRVSDAAPGRVSGFIQELKRTAVVGRQECVDPVQTVFLTSNRCQDFGIRKTDAGWHDRKPFRFFADPGYEFPVQSA